MGEYTLEDYARELAEAERRLEAAHDEADEWRSRAHEAAEDLEACNSDYAELQDEHARELERIEKQLQATLERNRDAFMFDLIGRNDPYDVIAELLDELAQIRRGEATP